MKTLVSMMLLCAVFSGASAAEKPWVIAENGKPRAVIVIRKDAGATIGIAAGELQKYVERISGARLPIMETIGPETPEFPRDTTVIHISPVGPWPPEKEESFVIRTERKSGLPPMIRLVGRGDVGAMYAVYAFIEKLGVRFF
ncbi:MAG: hypothetical protein NTU88_00295, partial [Armatimonadetes bacterium]|nr:hypothetical protein [Armatimonadota bacterium]